MTTSVHRTQATRVKSKHKQLSDYKGVVSQEVLEEITQKGLSLKGARAVHVNATSFGGGVAEILDNFIPLMNDIGIRTDWRVLHGTPEFFEVTKKFHNALQGADLRFEREEFQLYEFINEKFARFASLDHEYVIIHDPQPCALVSSMAHSSPWVWRCHIDITHPNPQAWEFMEPYIRQYQKMVVSSEIYKRADLDLEQRIISPSIDPLSAKNVELPRRVMDRYLADHMIPMDKPLITQVSRFDPWKDPEGVLQVYERVKQEVDCRMVFCYNTSVDDPEGFRIYERMLEAAAAYLQSGQVLFVRGDDPRLVNTLQSRSNVILQKSTREGFGLTVTEAMWKGTPVVASNVGGIPTQIVEGESGFLVDPLDLDTCAQRVVQLLQDPAMAAQIGQAARERVRQRFLITRHLLDYLNLMLSM